MSEVWSRSEGWAEVLLRVWQGIVTFFIDMIMKKYDIFISYRRDGGYETAKHLFDLLIRDGYSVSFDIDTLRNGDFDTALLKRIEECTDFILIVDKNAFDRCLNPQFNRNKDWLRCELAHALSHNKNVIPIMLAGVNSFPDNLPNDIVAVTKKNGPKHTMYYFDSFYKRLCENFLESKPNIQTITFLNDDDNIGMNEWNEPSTKLGKFIKNIFKEK